MKRKNKSPEIARLLDFMRSKNMKAAELAASIEIPERTLTNYIWNNKPLNGSLLRKLQSVHGISIDWVVAGIGGMYGAGESTVGEAATEYDDAADPLIPYFETTDLNNFADYWWLTARATEQSLIQSGATPGQDYSLLDLYRLAQPFVLERMRSPGLDVTTAEKL